jgi:hypothetical protein
MPSRFFRCCRISFACFSEKRLWRVLPTMVEMTIMPFPPPGFPKQMKATDCPARPADPSARLARDVEIMYCSI